MLDNELDLKTPLRQNVFTKQIFAPLEENAAEPLGYDQFAALYEDYAGQIFHYIQYRLGDGETAEDLTSQVFLKAWEKRENFKRTGAPIIAWLYTIARNTVIDDHRSNKKTLLLDEDGNYESENPSPSDQCELHFECEALKLALSSLTHEQHQVILWKFLEGFSTEEIAHRLGKREGTVRALQMRALRRLAEKLAEIDGEDIDNKEKTK